MSQWTLAVSKRQSAALGRGALLSALCLLGNLIANPSRAAANTFHAFGREIFQELVETDTTHSTGDTTRAAEKLAARFQAAGFGADDVPIVGPAVRNQNLVVRYRGSSRAPAVLFLGHLDVVEARRADWSFNPFILTETNGFFYGRGTHDMKDGDAALAAAFIRLRLEHFQPKRDLILALTAGEEGDAAEDGANWLVHHRRRLVEAAFCLNFDAGGPLREKGRPKFFELQASEKAYLTLQLEVKNRGGHSSEPRPDNAIYQLARGLVRLSRLEFPVHLNEITRGYFAAMAKLETGQPRGIPLGINIPQGQAGADMGALLQARPEREAVGRLSRVPAYNALLRTTAVATLLEAGHAENALPQSARATVNCRMVPGETQEQVIAKIRSALQDDQIQIAVTEPALTSPVSPLKPELLETVGATVKRIWPELAIVPAMSAGASDGLYLRQNGIPTYGVSGSFSDLDDLRAHGKDERIGVGDFYQALDFAYELARRAGAAGR